LISIHGLRIIENALKSNYSLQYLNIEGFIQLSNDSYKYYHCSSIGEDTARLISNDFMDNIKKNAPPILSFTCYYGQEGFDYSKDGCELSVSKEEWSKKNPYKSCKVCYFDVTDEEDFIPFAYCFYKRII
jgi:hypothetical protein